MPFVVESSSIENGVLTLRLGKDVTADLEIKVMLHTPPWEVPAGKKFNISKTTSVNTPQVVLAWKEQDQGAPSEQKFNDKYTMLLELGQEQDNKLPGKIYLSLPDEVKAMWPEHLKRTSRDSVSLTVSPISRPTRLTRCNI